MYTQKQIFTGKTTAHKQNFCQYNLFRTQINKRVVYNEHIHTSCLINTIMEMQMSAEEPE